jgi:hypothetical protein
MSEPKKYVTFRDLKDLNKPDKATIKENSTTSISSTTSIPRTPNTPSISSTTRSSSSTRVSDSDDRSLKSTTNTSERQRTPNKSIAPERDFQRVPNSITREALQEGLFRGKSKQVWDYLWSISRGAVAPTRIIRKSRKEIKSGSGLGSMVTVDAAIEHLKNIGLLKVRPAVGSLVGNEYEIFTPEELELLPTSSTRYTSISSTTSPTHKLDDLDVLDSGISSTTQTVENTVGYRSPNTFINTIDDDDTHTLLNYFSKTLLEAAHDVVGGKLTVTEQERVLWNECACVLADELKAAAEHAETISSVPAFLAAHLRRRFARKTKADNKNADQNSKPSLVPQAQSVASNKETSAAINPTPANVSKFTLGECRQYAEHLQKTGQGITNPGGYATTIYRTGEADALIKKFLNPERFENEDISQCPDCKGLGFIYPEGIDRGVVAKCKHPRLSRALKVLEEINRLQTLHSGDSSYQFSDMKEDLRFWCEREGVTDDDQIIDLLLKPYA